MMTSTKTIDRFAQRDRRSKTPKGMVIMTAKVHTPATLATDLGTTAKTVRKFLRSDQGLDSKVGKGKRWSIDSKTATGLKRRFPKWLAAQEAERKARQDAKVEETEVDDTTDETPVEQDPTDEEIAELDDEVDEN